MNASPQTSLTVPDTGHLLYRCKGGAYPVGWVPGVPRSPEGDGGEPCPLHHLSSPEPYSIGRTAVIEADLVVHGIGQLVTCEPTQGEGPLGLLENAAVAARQGQIIWVGPTSRWQGRLEMDAHATIVDAQGCCVLPGFVDAHSHLLWAGSRADEYAARVRG